MPTVNLTESNDNWSTSAAGAYLVNGLGGNDTLRVTTSRFAGENAVTGGDTLNGGDGNDYLSGALTNDSLMAD